MLPPPPLIWSQASVRWFWPRCTFGGCSDSKHPLLMCIFCHSLPTGESECSNRKISTRVVNMYSKISETQSYVGTTCVCTLAKYYL